MINSQDRQLFERVLSSGEEIGVLSLVKVMRQGSLLLALPMDRHLAKATLELYQPQKWKGKLLQKLILFLVVLGLHRLLPKLKIKLGNRGLFANQEKGSMTPDLGFLLSSADSVNRNLIGIVKVDGLLCVIKAGCGKIAEVVRHEYESIQLFVGENAGAPKCMGIFDIEDGVAYITEFVAGRSPRNDSDDTIILALLNRWLSNGSKKRLSGIACWQECKETLDVHVKNEFSVIDNLEVISPIMHGDFTPWNIKICRGKNVKVLDWEYARQCGVPGWDWLHYHIQRLSLVCEASVESIMHSCQELLHSNAMQDYLIEAGMSGHESLLLGSYLYYSGRVHGYPREEMIKLWVKEKEALLS